LSEVTQGTAQESKGLVYGKAEPFLTTGGEADQRKPYGKRLSLKKLLKKKKNSRSC
jgi:hypothetical protein